MAQLAHNLQDLHIIDTHVHVGPELGTRFYDVFSLTEELQSVNIRALVARGYSNIFGSVSLNNGVGGISSEAIRAAVSGNKAEVRSSKPDDRPFIVWMPSIHSLAHLAVWSRDLLEAWGVDSAFVKSRSELKALTILDSLGQLTPETDIVLDEIARSNVTLATGHLSQREIFALVPRAVEKGIKNIIVTHPFYKVSDMSVEDQATLLDLHAHVVNAQPDPTAYLLCFEYTYTGKTIDGIPIESYKAGIERLGSNHIVLSSDAGQLYWPKDDHGNDLESPRPATSVSKCWQNFVSDLEVAGIDYIDIRQMASINLALLLSLK